MTTYRTRKSRAVAKQAADLAVAVPQVMAHRLTRMALAGPVPSARDRREFDLMSAEKWSAFTESWNAMAMQWFREYQRLVLTTMQSFWFPSASTRRSVKAAANQLGGAGMGILQKGGVPIRRRAVANAKRLGRTRL